ncbi:chorismate synthase [Ammonifex degensii KC4]|uniref:Chorismate synthase n=1 Tax=Ammonifex degensii (strain DSM 10501 / KC4) TaxID=429009 RepID=C9RC27_AMMDK|nr:chorismate synthase [Ammonifex degensii]ACX51804.1 chorismate synthase [Ammonifex degensii KC4]
MLRYLTAGESHGQALLTIIEGMPAGLWLTADYIDRQLERRQGGYGRGARQRIERDRVEILSGVRGGFTLGSPIALKIANRDWENWREVMNPGLEARLDERVITRPRPGHADLAGALKYAFYDLRNVLERASARETVARVAAGAVARRFLEELGITLAGQVVQIGEVKATPAEGTPEEIRSQADASPVYCPDPQASAAMVEAIERAEKAGDTLGGIFEVRVYGVPPGLGSYVHWDRRLDGRLAQALMSIPGIKGVEIGLGFALASLPGSRAHDEIFYSPVQGYYRVTNRAGGLEGGVTNGEPIVVRAVMKPIPTLRKPLRSVDMFTKEPVAAAYERADICAVPAACVIGEAVVAWEIAAACLEKFGGDTMAELKESFLRYKTRIRRGER